MRSRANTIMFSLTGMPSLGMITVNALAAADSVIIPVQAHYLPAKGMTQLLQTINRVKKNINPNLKIEGRFAYYGGRAHEFCKGHIVYAPQ